MPFLPSIRLHNFFFKSFFTRFVEFEFSFFKIGSQILNSLSLSHTHTHIEKYFPLRQHRNHGLLHKGMLCTSSTIAQRSRLECHQVIHLCRDLAVGISIDTLIWVICLGFGSLIFFFYMSLIICQCVV